MLELRNGNAVSAFFVLVVAVLYGWERSENVTCLRGLYAVLHMIHVAMLMLMRGVLYGIDVGVMFCGIKQS